MNAVLPLLALAASGQEPSEATFDKYFSAIVPMEQELAWQKIPWHPSVWDAVLEGQKKDMPIILWMMNGHPLGCT